MTTSAEPVLEAAWVEPHALVIAAGSHFPNPTEIPIHLGTRAQPARAVRPAHEGRGSDFPALVTIAARLRTRAGGCSGPVRRGAVQPAVADSVRLAGPPARHRETGCTAYARASP